MIANRFNHSSFPQETEKIGHKRSEENGFRRHITKMENPRDSSSSDDEPPKEFESSKIPLEGIDLLLNRDKVPHDISKKEDKLLASDFKPREMNGSNGINGKSHFKSFKDKKSRNSLMEELDDVISDAESVTKERRRPRFIRKKDKNEENEHSQKLTSFFPPKNYPKSPPPHKTIHDDLSEGSVGTDISVNSADIRRASGSDISPLSSHRSNSSSSEYSGSSEYSESSSEASADSQAPPENRRWRPASHMTKEEIQAEKEQLLYDYGNLENNGYKTGIKMDMKTPLDTLRSEVFRLKKLRNVQRSIRFQRKMLVSATSGMEYVNKRFNPYKFSLDGWSGEVLDNIGDYDEVFEELHDKYSDSMQMAPELRLMAMVGGSGLMYHLSHTLFQQSTPELNDILKSRPDIMAQIQGAALGQMASQHAGDPLFGMMMNGMNMANQQRQNTSSFSQAGREPAPRTSFDNPQHTRGPMPSNSSHSVGASVNEVPRGQGIMKGPEGVDDILAQLNSMEASRASLISDDDVDSIKEVNTSSTKVKKPRGKKNNVIDLDM